MIQSKLNLLISLLLTLFVFTNVEVFSLVNATDPNLQELSGKKVIRSDGVCHKFFHCKKHRSGPTGPTGPTGLTGATGPTGAAGASAPSNFVSVFSINSDSVNLTNGQNVRFNHTGSQNGNVTFTSPDTINIATSGTYRVTFGVGDGGMDNSAFGLIATPSIISPPTTPIVYNTGFTNGLSGLTVDITLSGPAALQLQYLSLPPITLGVGSESPVMCTFIEVHQIL